MEEEVYLLSAHLDNVHCFKEKTTLELETANKNEKWTRWTVLLGNNGTGKTSLLRLLSLIETSELYSQTQDGGGVAYQVPEIGHFIRSYSLNSRTGMIPDFKVHIKLLFSNTSEIITFQRQNNGGIQGVNALRDNSIHIYGYGANRSMSQNSLNEPKSENSATLFDDDAKLINAEEWLVQLDYSTKSSNSYELVDFFSKRREMVIEILKNLLPDIGDIRFTEPTRETPKISVLFQTPYGWVTIPQLSLGYKTMVAWMVDLAARLFERYPDSDNPLAEPAIVLVDEIDLHMHPQWQRKIFDYLSEKFPKTQFIVTAHSPLIVQSAPKDANIVLLRREGDHVVIDNDIQSVHNWRIDQILNSDLFGNISPRSEAVEEWIEERKRLIQKAELSEDEKVRLHELNKKAHNLPTADNPRDIEAMEIIRKAADYLKSQTV